MLSLDPWPETHTKTTRNMITTVWSPPAAVVVGTAGAAQAGDDILLVEIAALAGVYLDAVVGKNLLDGATLNAGAGLAHDLRIGANPHDQHELDAAALGVVGVLDACVGV